MGQLNRFAKYAWFVLGYNLLVILWGALVRASGSGAGCGSHWPLCNGEVVPRSPQIETLIELTHRLTSGLAGVLVLVLLVWAWRTYPKGHRVRRGAVLAFVFVVLEGLIGAGLVLLELVAQDESLGRVFAIALHLNNTLILVAFLSLTAWWASGGPDLRLRGQGEAGWLLGLCFVSLMILATLGAVTALGDTLFRPESLSEGLSRDFDATAHFLERFRFWHPLMAVVVGGLLWFTTRFLARYRTEPGVARLGQGVMWLFALQFFGGMVNIYLLAPIWMQLLHLFLANLLWIAFVFLVATALATPTPTAETAFSR